MLKKFFPELSACPASQAVPPRTALAVAGTVRPLEFVDLRATAEHLEPVTQATGGGIAWFAHIGGFIAGVVMIVPVWIKRKRFFRH